jgi:hypothetical protein
MDILCNTKQDNSFFEEMNEGIINCLISASIVILIIQKYQ